MRLMQATLLAILRVGVLISIGVALGAVGQANQLFDGLRPSLAFASGWDWPVISSVLVAAATALLALFTWRGTRHGQAAVAAAQAATLENRRWAVFGATPFLAPSRPVAYLADGDLQFRIEAVNLGPGHALQIGFEVWAQEREDEPFLAVKAHSIASGVLASGDMLSLVGGAQDLQDRTVAWTADPVGQWGPPPAGIFRPIRLRITLSWLSTMGGAAKLTYVWDTRDGAGRESDTWRFESLVIDPGRGSGEPMVVANGRAPTQ